MLLIISGCAKKDVIPGETMFKESSGKFDPEDGKFKIPFDIPKAEDADKAKNQSLK